jgi:hypothetical protein
VAEPPPSSSGSRHKWCAASSSIVPGRIRRLNVPGASGAWRSTIVSAPDCELMLPNQALTELAAFDLRQARVVQLRFFGGFSEQDVAEVLVRARGQHARRPQSAAHLSVLRRDANFRSVLRKTRPTSAPPMCAR